jgi:hypothetical protein
LEPINDLTASYLAGLAFVERIIGPPNQPSAASIGDLIMLVVHSGKERRQEEFEVLFGQVGLELIRVINTGASFSILEARPV